MHGSSGEHALSIHRAQFRTQDPHVHRDHRGTRPRLTDVVGAGLRWQVMSAGKTAVRRPSEFSPSSEKWGNECTGCCSVKNCFAPYC
jgi:hypothetical protein